MAHNMHNTESKTISASTEAENIEISELEDSETNLQN